MSTSICAMVSRAVMAACSAAIMASNNTTGEGGRVKGERGDDNEGEKRY